MKEKVKYYRPAIAAFLVIVAMALTSSTISFFLEPVCESLQISRGSYSLIFSLMSVTGALTSPFLGRYAGKKGVWGILFVTGLWGGTCMILLSTVTQLWMLYAVALCLGMFGSSSVCLCGTFMVQQAYPGPEAAGILGAVMAGSGVGGILFSLFIPEMIEVFGWRIGMRAVGISWMSLVWLGMLLLGRQSLHLPGNSSAAGLGMTRSEAMRSPKLYLQMVVIVIITGCCGIQQQLPSMLGAKGFSSGEVRVMVSATTAFLALGKFGQGVCYGKMGVKKGGFLLIAIFVAGNLLMLTRTLIWPALILLALGMGICTTLLPQVARDVFGTREYASIWALISTVGCIGTILGYPLWGVVYDLTGDYTWALIGAAALLAGTLWAHCNIMKKRD